MTTTTPMPTQRNPAPPPPPERIGIMRSAARYPLLVILPVLVLVGAALFIGLKRTPAYTAEARLTIGRLDVSAPGALAGFSAATQSLASSYSRSIDAEQIITPLSRQFRLTPKATRSRLVATPIPQSPVFRISARGTSERQSIDLANAASAQLIAYIGRLNAESPDTSRLGKQYRAASLVFSRDRQIQRRLQKRADLNPDDSGVRARLSVAQANAQTALLKREAIGRAYDNTTQGASNTALVQQLTRAEEAASDRLSFLQLIGFLGLVAGLVIGLGLATFRANLSTRRAI